MSKKFGGAIHIVLGLAWIMVALTADPLGLGAAPGIGWKQWLAAGAGVIVVFIGLFLLVTAPSK